MASKLPSTTDIAIIGGGIMGASLAWELTRRAGGQTVTLFERATVASGASGKTGALLRQHYTNRAEATLAHESLQVFRHWEDAVGGSCGFVESGLIVTIPTGPDAEENVARLHRNVAMQRSVGIDTMVISPEELRDRQPYAAVDDIAAATYEPSSGYVDAVAATRSLCHAAMQFGATIVEGCPVLAIETDAGRVTAVRTALGTVGTGAVVCAAGPWSVQLFSAVGIRVPLQAMRVQVVVLHRPLHLEPPHAAYVDAAAGMFCRPWGIGRTLVGISGGDQHDPVNPDRYEERIDPGYPSAAREVISRRMPAMMGAACFGGHVGLYDMSPDAHPILGSTPIDGLYLMAGFSGAGFKKAPAIARCLVDLIVDGQSPLVDLTPFRLDRFAGDAWQAPWSDTEYVLPSNFGHTF